MSCVLSKCAECAHFLKKKPEDPLACKAYPGGIPKDWFLRGNPELMKECNNGYSYEPYAKKDHDA